MRIAVLIVASTLIASCAQGSETRPGATRLTPVSPSRSAERTPSAPQSAPQSATGAAGAPRAGAAASEAIAWVEAAGPVDAAEFHVALRGGASTPLGEDVAFSTPFGANCMTDVKRSSSDLACLVDLTDPPPQPPAVYGAWKGGWVDFDGTSVRIGSGHGDPGRFAAGQGVPLPQGRSLSFGDFRCRTDTDTLICVNYAHRTAVRYSDAGVDALGCTRQSPPAAGVGVQYDC